MNCSPPRQEALLQSLCKRYVAAKNAGDLKTASVLERQVRSLDGSLVIDKRGPAVVCGIIHYFFRVGYNSKETALALKHVASPCAVRQVAWRLNHLWERMKSGNDLPPKPAEIARAKSRAWYHLSGYRDRQRDLIKAKLAAETPEQTAARIAYHRDYYQKNKARIVAVRKANWKIREKAIADYHNATEEEKEVRCRKQRDYQKKNRAHITENARLRYHKRRARMSAEEKEIFNARARAYAAAHREQRRVIKARYKAKKAGRFVAPPSA